MTALLTTPLIPISKKMGSHRGAQGIIYGSMFREDGVDLVANISGEHYESDFNKYEALYVYHGNDWGGSVNLFGGLKAFPYIHNLVNFSKFKGPVYSIGIDFPDYAGMLETLMARPSSLGKVNPEWYEADFTNLRDMCDRSVTVFPKPRTKVVGGDSHAICMYRPGWETNAVQYKTLYGALKMGLEQFVAFRRPLKELEEVEFYFSNIDIRHHLCRQPDPLGSARELAKNYYLSVLALGGGGFLVPKRIYEPLPIENEKRSLPKTGYYQGAPFFGSWQERNDVRLAFRDELLRCEKEFGGVEIILWVDQTLEVNSAGELSFSSMEVPHSVHLSRAHYPYWRGFEWNHLDDPHTPGLGPYAIPREKGLDQFL